MHCQFNGVGSMGDSNRKTSDTLPKPGKVDAVCKEWIVHEDGALAYQLQKLEVDKHYNDNRSRNAIVRQDLPTAREEQEREIREAEQRYCAFIKEQEKRDLKLALELAEHIAKKKNANELSLKMPTPIENVRHGILKKSSYPVHVNRLEETKEYTELDIDDILNDIEYEEECKRHIQEEKDAELARRLQEQERPLSVEDRDRLIAIETQDCELAKLLQEKEKAKLRRAREKAKQKALLRKYQQLEKLPESESPVQPESLSNIAIAIDPTYSPRNLEAYEAPTSSSNVPPMVDISPYMPIQGQRRNQSEKKKKSKSSDGVTSFFKVFK
ncbi:coiled-coil domain-containing protein 50 isoform X2 [Daktulosphaira vitifoliae]|uniref:coiled-coil domain-containing protein 50 isoform X2 n=1 Tax=Daktulosphaira vitifoliae TaxID=58002 RepID=UPI0021A9BD27|nr:coiled-coil domain-containing protein 50 isoform X2 [Daktulosphaira vitifoliae]